MRYFIDITCAFTFVVGCSILGLCFVVSMIGMFTGAPEIIGFSPDEVISLSLLSTLAVLVSMYVFSRN